MTAPPKASLPMPVNIQTALMRATDIPLPFYRFLYTQVGMRYHWHERLRMSDVELKSILNDPRTSVTVLYINGAPAGYFELFKQDDDVVELAYFGLFERAIGLGVGKVVPAAGALRGLGAQPAEGDRLHQYTGSPARPPALPALRLCALPDL